MNCPTKKVWITETMYGLLGDPIPDEKCEQLVRDTYEYAGIDKFVFWYAFNRPDLNKGFLMYHDSTTWEAIKRYG